LSKIDEVSAILKQSHLLGFARAFDFDQDRFGSPRTRENFASREFLFRRRYLVLKTIELECLIIFTKIPFGVSPFNNTSIVFALPLIANHSAFTQEIANLIGQKVASEGVFPHRIVYLTNVNAKISMESNLPVRTVIAEPRLWLNS
jgi:hypothetical protein